MALINLKKQNEVAFAVSRFSRVHSRFFRGCIRGFFVVPRFYRGCTRGGWLCLIVVSADAVAISRFFRGCTRGFVDGLAVFRGCSGGSRGCTRGFAVSSRVHSHSRISQRDSCVPESDRSRPIVTPRCLRSTSTKIAATTLRSFWVLMRFGHGD